MSDNESPPPLAKPRHVWPWFVLAALVLGIVLAVLWVNHEVRRVQSQREYGTPPAR